METSINHAQEAGIVKLAEDGSAFTTSLIVAEAIRETAQERLASYRQS